MKKLIILLLFILIVPLNVYSSQLFHTIQTSSFTSVPDAQKQFDSIVNKLDETQLDNLRIEKIGKFYSVRLGKFMDYESAVKFFGTVKPKMANAAVMKAYIKKERIVKLYSDIAFVNIKESEDTPVLDNVKSKTTKKADNKVSGVPLKKDIEKIEEVNIKTADIKASSHNISEKINPQLTGEIDKKELGIPLKENSKNIEAPFKKNDNVAAPDIITSEITEQPEHFDASTGPGNAYAKNDNSEKAMMDDLEKNDNSEKAMMDDLDLTLEGLDLEEDDVTFNAPIIKPETGVTLGYRFSDFNGSTRAMEYDRLKDSPVAYGDVRFFKYPHRTFVEFDFHNDKDYMGEVRYSFKDLVQFRFINHTFYHNLDNIRLTDPDPTSTVLATDITRDEGKTYGVKTGMSEFKIRLKTPNFPAHVFLNGVYSHKDGSQQQRSLLGSGFYTEKVRSTQKRDVDQITRTYDMGVNSHLGPVEVEYIHREKRFDVDADQALFDSYSTVGIRLSGDYPHNQVSELKSSSNRVSIHSDLTGSIVASASFVKKDRENRNSGATEDAWHGTGSIRWSPLTRLSLFFKYSHKDLDADNPRVASITDSSGSTITYPMQAKPSVSKKSDSFNVTALYRPESRVSLKARFIYKDISRSDVGQWNLPESTKKKSAFFQAKTRIARDLKIKANYQFEIIDNPAYNTDPEHSEKGMVSVAWHPIRRVNLFARYSRLEQSREGLSFEETSSVTDRAVNNDNVTASGTFQIMNNLSLTTTYAYMKLKIDQDIVYSNGGPFLIDADVPYTDKVNFYSAAINYAPISKLNLQGQVSYLTGKNEFEPDDAALLSTVSIASFSEQKVEETVYQISGDYECPKGFSCAIDYKYVDFNDALDNVNDSNQDGDAYIILLRLTKRWG